jgi:hypothetical protein
VAETRKLEAILCSDVVGYSRLAIGAACDAHQPLRLVEADARRIEAAPLRQLTDLQNALLAA